MTSPASPHRSVCVSFSARISPIATSKIPKASHTHIFLPLLAAARIPALQIIEHDWHNDIIAMARDRLPRVALVLLFLFILQRIVKFFVKRMQALAIKSPVVVARSAQLRTMATILRATSYSILGFLAFLQILKLFNVNLAPILASAGILGVGIGLGAQSLFKDIINGCFILIEDQYNVGEIVRIAALTGTVEDLTLRSTRLRDADGTLYIIPNSQVATVSNLSRDFSIATLTIAVDASANPDHVIATLRQVTAALYAEPAFTPKFLDAPTVLGVDRIDGRAIQYPILFRVRPNQKDELLRELRRRILLTFESESIPFGSDPTMLTFPHPHPTDPTAPPPQQPLTAP